jgi:hypothetical protein
LKVKERIAAIAKQLMDLLQHGAFTLSDLEFMEKFLEAALVATRKVKTRAQSGKEGG